MDKLCSFTRVEPICVASWDDVPVDVLLSVFDWGLLKTHFASPCAPPVWVVPAQTCPECATRRNLADNPGA